MKQRFIEELENQINIHDVENKQEILEKYRKRYEFGLEAGLSEEEIEKMLGNPKDIIKDYIYSNNQEIKEEYKELLDKYDIMVHSLCDDIHFVCSKDDGVHAELQNINVEAYEIEKTDTKLKICYKKSKFFSLNRKKGGKIQIEIPKNKLLGIVDISTTSGDINIPNLEANEFKINMVSGDCNLENIEVKIFICHLVSADVLGESILADEMKIDTVSGDIKIDFAVANNVKIDTVSGDVKIVEGKLGNVSSTSVTGDIMINGTPAVTNVKNYVKGMFR